MSDLATLKELLDKAHATYTPIEYPTDDGDFELEVFVAGASFWFDSNDTLIEIT